MNIIPAIDIKNGKVVKAIQRNRAGIKDPNKPIGSFIFLGQTGVGKTQLAKVLSDELLNGLDISPDFFWQTLENLIYVYGPLNKSLLEKSIEFRKKQGAILIESPNSKIKLYKDKIILSKLEKTISQIIIAESMILMGYVTSLFLDKYNLAAAYRIQPVSYTHLTLPTKRIV